MDSEDALTEEDMRLFDSDAFKEFDSASPSKRAKIDLVRPTVYSGVVREYTKVCGDNCPSKSAIVLKVDVFAKANRAPRRLVRTSKYYDIRSSTLVHVGDLINLILLSPSLDDATILVSNTSNNYIILFPDLLFTATTIATSYTCLRKSLLSDYMSISDENRYTILGRMKHQLIEEVCCMEWPSAQPPSSLVERLHVRILLLLRENYPRIRQAHLPLRELYDDLHSAIPSLVEVYYHFNTCLPVASVLKAEDTVWSREWGLKGVLDLSIRNREGLAIPVEIKTGKEDPVSHTAQLLLYALLLSQRDTSHSFVLSQPGRVAGILLYLTKDPLAFPTPSLPGKGVETQLLREVDSLQPSPYWTQLLPQLQMRVQRLSLASGNSPHFLTARVKNADVAMLRALILRRNLLAAYTMLERAHVMQQLETSTVDIEDMNLVPLLPEVLSSGFYCEKCPYARLCALFHRMAEVSGTPSRESNVEIDRVAERVLPSSFAYFTKWYSCIYAERRYQEHTQKGKREEAVETAELLACQTCPSEGRPHRHTHPALSWECAASGNATLFAVEATSLPLSEGDRVSVSCSAYGLLLQNAAIHTVEHRDGQVLLVVISAQPLLLPGDSERFRVKYCITRSKIAPLSLVTTTSLLHTVTGEKGDGSEWAATNPLFPRLRSILIEGAIPERETRFPSLDAILDVLRQKEEESAATFLLEDDGDYSERHRLTSAITTLLRDCNSDQREAIRTIMNSSDLSLLQGLPGTGKTTVVTLLVLLYYLLGKRILLASHTHTAIDTILLKLLPYHLPLLRIGEESRVHPLARRYLLHSLWDGKVQSYEATLAKCRIVAATVYTSPLQLLRERVYDVCIMDEAGQIAEPACLLALQLAQHLILVGDSKQLPPLVQSSLSSQHGLSVSLLSRLESRPGGPHAYISTLKTQYRMNGPIMQLANFLIYGGILQCGSPAIQSATFPVAIQKSCATWLRRLADAENSVVFVDTDGEKPPSLEQVKKEGRSRYNDAEIGMILEIIRLFAEGRVDLADVGIVSPYVAQVDRIRQKCKDEGYGEIEVSTVDKFQGRDKECILVSLVRSNARQSVGSLLKDWRRLNVAFTRARRKLIIIGSSSTLANETEWNKLLQYIKEHCCYLQYGMQLCVYYKEPNAKER